MGRGNVYPDGKIRGKFFEIDDPKDVVGVRDWTWKSGTKGSVYNFPIKTLDELDYRLYLVKQKYEHMSWVFWSIWNRWLGEKTSRECESLRGRGERDMHHSLDTARIRLGA